MKNQEETRQTGLSINDISKIHSSVPCHIYIVSDIDHRVFLRSHTQARGTFELDLKEIVLFLEITRKLHGHTH